MFRLLGISVVVLFCLPTASAEAPLCVDYNVEQGNGRLFEWEYDQERGVSYVEIAGTRYYYEATTGSCKS